MSRLTNARTAVRPALKARMMLSGPAGAGKTRSALICAERLTNGGKVLVIDTEKESALTYADDFEFQHLPWEAPFDPRELATVLQEAGDSYDAVIVDSLSHFWRGSGGTLDIADGKFTGWKAARPAQDDLVDGILECKAHVILCGRAKIDHVQEVDERGRHVVRKLGMATIQDDTLEYELNVACEIDMEHRMTVSKSRCTSVPVGRTFAPGHAEDFADLYRDWLAGGEPPAAQAKVDALVTAMNDLPVEQRKACKQEFVAKFGRPDHLPESRLAEAEAFVRDHKVSDVEEGAAETEQPSTDDAGAEESRRLTRQLMALIGKDPHVTEDNRKEWAGEQLGRTVGSFTELDDDDKHRLIEVLQESQREVPV